MDYGLWVGWNPDCWRELDPKNTGMEWPGQASNLGIQSLAWSWEWWGVARGWGMDDPGMDGLALLQGGFILRYCGINFASELLD